MLAVDPGSVAGVTLTVTFTTAIDSDTQTASRSVGVSGEGARSSASGRSPRPVELAELRFEPQDSDFQYGFFCDRSWGIETDFTLRNVQATLVLPAATGLGTDGVVQFANAWRLQADYDVDAGLFSESGSLDIVSEIVRARFNTGGGDGSWTRSPSAGWAPNSRWAPAS